MDSANGPRRSEGRRLAEMRQAQAKERDKAARKERETIRAADAAKTARLRALRLARDAADLAAPAPEVAPPKRDKKA